MASKKSTAETSPKVARDASSHLRSKATSTSSKSVAGTGLSEVVPGRSTSAKQATKASAKLRSSTTGARGKRIAGAVLNDTDSKK